MSSSRRAFLSLTIPFALLARSVFAQKGAIMKARMPTLGTGQGQSAVPTFSNSGPPADPTAMLREKQAAVRKDALQLYELAGDLLQQVGTSDSSTVLSLPLLKKAEQIQRLAKHIRSLARG